MGIKSILLVVAALVISVNVKAADLTGSYEGTISCTTQAVGGDTVRQTYPAWAHISQENTFTGSTWYQMHYWHGGQAAGPGYKASHLVETLDAPSGNSTNGLETGSISAIQCGTHSGGPIQYSIKFNQIEFGVGDFTIRPNGTTKLDFIYYRQFVNKSECKLNLERTTIADPIVTRDGPSQYSEPQEYRCPDRPF